MTGGAVRKTLKGALSRPGIGSERFFSRLEVLADNQPASNRTKSGVILVAHGPHRVATGNHWRPAPEFLALFAIFSLSVFA